MSIWDLELLLPRSIRTFQDISGHLSVCQSISYSSDHKVFLLGDAATTSLGHQGCQRAKELLVKPPLVEFQALKSGQGCDIYPLCCSCRGPGAGRMQRIHTALLTASDKGADTMQMLSDKEREELLLPEQIKDSTGSLRSRMCWI